jgi:hypothetical protein
VAADPFATADDAEGYGYPLPDATASTLLVRATQLLLDAAGFAILAGSTTVRLQARHRLLSLKYVPLVTDVTGVVLSLEDGTTETVSDWHWPGLVEGVAEDIRLGGHVREWARHDGYFSVTVTQGLSSVPDSLVLLTCSVAYRLAAMPAAMSAGVTARTVGSTSWQAPKAPSDGELTPGELRRLQRIVPLRRTWQVPT